MTSTSALVKNTAGSLNRLASQLVVDILSALTTVVPSMGLLRIGSTNGGIRVGTEI